ncbi:TetR/AcrR family transcriptional regulator [Parasphingopyxis sp.]|uniref:TetR/AcrR family transcriptional regulator n=1 Tax=Parasphingopyxis sp. TaxID=1920299 RepID=UPI00263861CB|nr:TetR/AcrR family transcriptional regulator [Parasphingopyxis sp.]
MSQNDTLHAVLRVFALYGFRKTSMGDLAHAMGISRQALYNRFSSKEGVFGWATKTLIEQSAAETLAMLEDDGLDIPDRLMAAYDIWAGQHVETLRASPHAAEILTMVHGEAAELSEQAERYINAKVAKLFAGQSAGISDARAVDMAHTLYWASKGLLHTAKDHAAYRDGLARVISALVPA